MDLQLYKILKIMRVLFFGTQFMYYVIVLQMNWTFCWLEPVTPGI